MKAKLLVQLDSDAAPSLFDRIVAVDAGAERLFSYGGVKPEQVQDFVHGAIFTRGQEDLSSTAIFVGGSDVSAGEEILSRAQKAFIGKLRISLMLDSGGANTTAAAAVLSIESRLELKGKRAIILGGTGPVGMRVARLLLRRGAEARIGSRIRERAATACAAVAAQVGSSVPPPTAWPWRTDADMAAGLDGVEVVVSAGGAGVTLLTAAARQAAKSIKVAVDLNAVPPAGIEGVEPMDKARALDGADVYGALAVGGLKMKIHKAAIARLFESNEHVLDAEEILELGRSLAG